MTEENPDAVDRIAEQWAHERPELDLGPMLVVGRLHPLHLANEDRLLAALDADERRQLGDLLSKLLLSLED